MFEHRKIEQLFRQHYAEMIHLARVLLGDDDEAEDVVQDIFLHLAATARPPRGTATCWWPCATPA